jgi:DNA invertase Pin-like site-specific DNA recombinase
MARIGYARVSNNGNRTSICRLLHSRSQIVIESLLKKFLALKNVPELQAALKYMRAGDTLIVYKFDRIGRSLKDLVNIFADLQKRDITLISLKDNIDATTKLRQVYDECLCCPC